ncbi:alpha/beta hydrolase [Streptacidiphilus cavernicola]|uniref:Alpha/beta hydrolase n=1 Tax=Streptacidiphilus cavernicola TaxID=3342716 RepID=A0ABV6W182_9ACTN
MRWGRAATVTALGAGSAALGAAAAALVAGRVASDFAVRPRGPAPAAAGGLKVHAVGGGRVELTRSWESQRPGRYALEWDGGRAAVGEVVGGTSQTVVRALEPVAAVGAGRLAVGDTVRITPLLFDGDPRTALGLEFDEFDIQGDLGPMPAWFLPGARDLCLIAVHGIGADRGQVLPLLPLFDRLRVPVLAVTYRNDRGAPRSPDGLGRLGAGEWPDVDAAIRFAGENGARRIVLFGWSVGATMALQAAVRSASRAAVCGLVLDSPVLDWRGTVRRQATRRGVPAPLAELGVRAAAGRVEVDPHVYDRIGLGEGLTAPVLLLHSADDTVSPVGHARQLAARREDLVLYEEFRDAEHAALWNTDQDRYERTLSRFLTPLL